jgi:hypothetical protein
MNLLEDLRALFAFLTFSFESKFPSLSTRRGISGTVVAVTIAALIIIGGVTIYILATSSGVTTTSPYP